MNDRFGMRKKVTKTEPKKIRATGRTRPLVVIPFRSEVWRHFKLVFAAAAAAAAASVLLHLLLLRVAD